ncbi:GPCR kinase [Tanacetum coccineum]
MFSSGPQDRSNGGLRLSWDNSRRGGENGAWSGGDGGMAAASSGGVMVTAAAAAMAAGGGMAARGGAWKVVEDVGKDEDFKSGSWVSATDYVNANSGTVSGCLGDIKNFLKNGKLDQVVAIVKSCSLNVIGDLTVTMEDLSSTIPGTIHHKVIGEGGYKKDITVGVVLLLANVSVFSPKLLMHYLNITMRNVVKVFCKDTVPGSVSG